MKQVEVHPNTPFKKGDVLFRIDETPYQNNVNRLTAALDAAKQGEQVAVASVDLACAGIIDVSQRGFRFCYG